MVETLYLIFWLILVLVFCFMVNRVIGKLLK